MNGLVALALALLAAAGCTSHSEETWIDPGVGRLAPEAESPRVE